MTETYGGRIRRIRKGRKWKLRELSARSGLSVPYLSNIEVGRMAPTLRALEKISRALDIAFVIEGESDESQTGQS